MASTDKRNPLWDGATAATFDYVIVGAGPSAMGLLLGLLLPFVHDEGLPFTIAVIERGQATPAAETLPVNRWYHASHQAASSTVSIEQGTTCTGRILDVPIGKGLGGSSNVNACLFVPPASDDFKSWPEPWRTQLISSIGIIQDHFQQNSCLYESRTVRDEIETWISHLFGEESDKRSSLWRETVFPSVRATIPCTAKKDSTSGRIIRRNYYDGLVAPLLRKYSYLKESIRFFCGFQAERLLFSGTRVVGVECSSQRYMVEIKAKKEVILCGGAIESPALLLASGIGNSQDLVAAKIPPCCPGFTGRVGHNLCDHVGIGRIILTPRPSNEVSPNGVECLSQIEVEGRRFQIALMDAAAYPDVLPRALAGCVLYRLPTENGRFRSFEFILNGFLKALFVIFKTLLKFLICYTPLYWLLHYHVATIGIFLLNPVSTGKISVKQKTPTSRVLLIRRSDLELDVELPYLKEDVDMFAVEKGFHASQSMRCALGGIELFPGFLVRSFGRSRFNRYSLKLFSQSMCQPYFHWSGTCRMKTDNRDDGWVVDSSLRVRSFQSLRVCDASAFPTTVSAPTALTCAGMGALLAEVILKESGIIQQKKD